jgi:signal transduction histidine kinase
MKIILLLLSILVSTSVLKAENTNDSLFIVLKKEIQNKKIYDSKKEERISVVKQQIKALPSNNYTEKYELYKKLFDEYYIYQRDSALMYADRLLTLAFAIGDNTKIGVSRIYKATVLNASGMFKEAFACLELVDTKYLDASNRSWYYSILSWANDAIGKYNSDKLYSPNYFKESKRYKDSVMVMAKPGFVDALQMGVLPDSTKTKRNENLNYYISLLDKAKLDNHSYGRASYILSQFYESDNKIRLLLIAAIYDIRSSTKETEAIYNLGLEYKQKGDIDKAYLCLKEAMSNALFFGSSSHKAEIASSLSYVAEKSVMRTNTYIIIAGALIVLLVFIIIGIWYNRSRLNILNIKIKNEKDTVQNALSDLQNSQKENENVMQIVAHDLRSPIATMISITNLLLEQNKLSPEDRDLVEMLAKAGDNSLGIINNILHTNTSKGALHKEPVELHNLLANCVNLLQYKASEKNQKIIIKTVNVILNVDREKIWRVFSNLITNAIKFSPENSIIEAEIVNGLNSVQISIRDYGIGIPEDMQVKIFDLFTDAKRKGTSGEESFGLGLAISKQIITAHGGTIKLNNQCDQGANFVVELYKSN